MVGSHTLVGTPLIIARVAIEEAKHRAGQLQVAEDDLKPEERNIPVTEVTPSSLSVN